MTLATFMSDIYGSCFSQPSGRTISGPNPTGNPSPLVASNLSARNSAIPEHDSMGLQTSIRSFATSVEVGNYASAGQQTTASAILRAEIPSSKLSMPRPPPQTSDMLASAQSPAVLQPGTRTTASFTQSMNLAVSRYSESEILTGPEHTSVLSTSHLRSPSIPNIRLSGNPYAGREIRAPAPHLRHTVPSPVISYSRSRAC